MKNGQEWIRLYTKLTHSSFIYLFVCLFCKCELLPWSKSPVCVCMCVCVLGVRMYWVCDVCVWGGEMRLWEKRTEGRTHLLIFFLYIQQVLISYLFYTHRCIHVNPNLPIHPPTTPLPPVSPPCYSLYFKTFGLDNISFM